MLRGADHVRLSHRLSLSFADCQIFPERDFDEGEGGARDSAAQSPER